MKTNEDWDLPDDYLTEIGRVTVRWSKLESAMHLSMIELLGKDMTEGRSLVLFTHMTFPLKLDVLGALISECLMVPAYSWLSDYKTTVYPLLTEAAKERNTIVHSKFGVEQGLVKRSNLSARGSLKVTTSLVRLRDIEKVSEVIVKASDALFHLVFSRKIAKQVEQMDL